MILVEIHKSGLTIIITNNKNPRTHAQARSRVSQKDTEEGYHPRLWLRFLYGLLEALKSLVLSRYRRHLVDDV